MLRDSVPFRVTTTRVTPTDGQAWMTTFSRAESGVRLKETRTVQTTFSAFGGFTSLVVSPFIISGLARGEWGVLFFAGIPAFLVVVGRCFRYFTPDDYLVLYPDRMEFACRRGEPPIVTWTEVISVHWPKTREAGARIVVSVPARPDWPLGKAWIALDHLSPDDGLKCIRYLRSSSAGLAQVGWPEFCRKWAVPVAEMIKNAENNGTREDRRSRWIAQPERYLEIFSRRPFVAGVTFPVVSLCVLAGAVLRSLWWIMAAIIAISGAINIRLVWGFWASPFTEIVMGFALGLFCMGLLAPTKIRFRNRSDEVSRMFTISSLAVSVIGGPLLANAMALGWVRIPNAVAVLIVPAFFLVLLSPALFVAVRRRRMDKGQAAALEADAIRRWEAYVNTGTLPETAEQGAGGA